MVEIMSEVPEREARMVLVPKGRPKAIGLGSYPHIEYAGGLEIPNGMVNEFLRKCGIDFPGKHAGRDELADRIMEANSRKDIYLRFADETPLSVVTGKFKEIRPSEILEEARAILGTDPVIRYFKNDERLQFNFPLNRRGKSKNVLIDTGSYGVYGGSGHSAASYGLSSYNPVCSNWTIFMWSTIKRDPSKAKRKIIHIIDTNLRETIESLVEGADSMSKEMAEAKDKQFTHDELGAYFTMYEKKGLNKRIAETIMEENTRGISAYDLSYRLTQLCQQPRLSDTTRGRIEHLAGEVVMCYSAIIDRVKEELSHPGNAAILPAQRN